MFGENEFGTEFALLDKGRLLVQKRWVELFRREGLTSFEDFMTTNKGQTIGRRSDRVRMRIELGDSRDRQVFYLKRHHRPKWFARMSSSLGFGFIIKTSPGRQEFINILRLKNAKLATMNAAAVGQSTGTDGSFIMVEELSGYVPLDDFLRGVLPNTDQPGVLQQLRELIGVVGAYVRKLHGRGMDHQDLYLCHFFVRPEDPASSLSLIDLQRVNKHRYVRWRGQLKDLAALNYSAGEVGISRSDRLRFALEYFQTQRLAWRQRKLLWLVKLKTRRIARHDRKLQIRYRGQGY